MSVANLTADLQLTPATAAPRRVVDAMVAHPTVHEPWTTVGQLRAFFRDDHVHMALIADADELIGAVERGDLTPLLDGDTPARVVARLDGRTIRPGAALSEALDAMKRDRRRRLAVTTDDSTLLGLLCLKASGAGFCSDADVRSRRC
jgi:CBS domain-containing protein